MNIVAGLKTQLLSYRQRQGEMAQSISTPNSEKTIKVDSAIDLTAPADKSRGSSKERFDKEVEFWEFDKSGNKKRTRSTGNASHQRTPPPSERTSTKQNDSPIPDHGIDLSNAATVAESTIDGIITIRKFTTISTTTTDSNGKSTTKKITTTNLSMLCPCCHIQGHSHTSPSRKKEEHHILPHLLNSFFVFPPEKRSWMNSQLTTFERYLHKRLLSAEETRFSIVDDERDKRGECLKTWGYDLYSPQNSCAIDDEEEEEWGIHTIRFGFLLHRSPKTVWEFGRIPRGKEELEMLRERYLRVFVERERSGIVELRYVTNADEVEDEGLRKVAERYWERDWAASLQYAGVEIEEMGSLGVWEGFDGVGVVVEEEEEDDEDDDDDQEESEDPNDSDYVDEFDGE
jgi:hypothetical protein